MKVRNAAQVGIILVIANLVISFLHARFLFAVVPPSPAQQRRPGQHDSDRRICLLDDRLAGRRHRAECRVAAGLRLPMPHAGTILPRQPGYPGVRGQSFGFWLNLRRKRMLWVSGFWFRFPIDPHSWRE